MAGSSMADSRATKHFCAALKVRTFLVTGIILSLLLSLTVLTACSGGGALRGTYELTVENEDYSYIHSYTFSGKDQVAEKIIFYGILFGEGTCVGTYEIRGDTIEFTWSRVSDRITPLEGPQSFEQRGNSIFINGAEFKKK